MKKLFIAAILFAAVATPASLVSCSAQSSSVALKTDVDSLSYAIGVSRNNGLVPYLAQEGIDSTLMNEFISGLKSGLNTNVENKKAKARVMGEQIGASIIMQIPSFNKEIFAGDSTKSLNKAVLANAFVTAVKGDEGAMTMEEANAYIQKTVEAIQKKATEAQYGPNKEAGEKFLAENKSNEGVQVTESGLQYKVLTEGKGAKPAATDKVKVNYRGTTIDGKEFDSSYKRGEPAEFGVSQVIPGWTEGLQLMSPGSKYMFWIPYELAYGERGQGSTIEPYAMLIFEVELLDIVK